MRIGTVCYATSRGLGHLAKSFIDHGVITDICIIEHPGIPTNWEWYPNAPRTSLKRLDRNLIRDFVSSMEALLCFETPFDWSVLGYCRERGIRTLLMTMYECSSPKSPQPDIYLCPSLLDLEYFPREKSVLVTIPVDLEKSPWRQRDKAEVFVHNGGYLGMQGREGTCLVIEAMEHVLSNAQLIVRCQENVDDAHVAAARANPQIDYRPQSVPFSELYATGDVAIGAQKWNGCSLPLQEAYASGLLVMNSDRFPANAWLPKSPLIPVREFRKGHALRGHNRIDFALVDPRDIAETIDKWYGRDISSYSYLGRQWAEDNSWEVWKPRYMELIQTGQLCAS